MDIDAIMALIKDIGAPAVGVLLTFKLLLNGMRKDVTEIKATVSRLEITQATHAIKLAVLQDRNERVDSPPSTI
jgi:hypothetical protein